MSYDIVIYASTINATAVNQIYNLIKQPPFLGATVRIMPDVHLGKDCVIGFTSTMPCDKVIPNVIGPDIGCGMYVVELGKLDIDLPMLDEYIKQHIPAGSESKSDANAKISNKCTYSLLKKLKCLNDLHNTPKIVRSFGSLGGGNHFIEIDEDDDGVKYLVIHSGSRSLGMQVASHYQNKAIKFCKGSTKDERRNIVARYSGEGRISEIPDALKKLTLKFAEYTKVPEEFCFLEGVGKLAYLNDLGVCLEYARLNRMAIADVICDYLEVSKGKSFESVHNFIDELGVIRKGAISAYKGEQVIIPLNMRDGCILGIGKGNPDWNESAPHGAGRLMSRDEAKSALSVNEFKSTMKEAGVFTTTVAESTLDESPMAYKSAEEIISLITPTVEVTKIIRPIYNFKSM